MSKRSGGGAIRIAVTATSAVRRAGLESIIRSHAEFHLAGSFGTMASLVSFARSTDLDVIVIDTDSIRDLLLEPTSDAVIVLLTEVTEARSISRKISFGALRNIVQRRRKPMRGVSPSVEASGSFVSRMIQRPSPALRTSQSPMPSRARSSAARSAFGS